MIYDMIKVAHLPSMVLWIGSAFTIPMVALHFARHQGASDVIAIGALRQTYVWLGGIGIVATWIFGLTLLSIGHWFDAPWVWAKLAVVLILSGLHGALSGRLKRFPRDKAPIPTGLFKALLAFHAVGLLTILTLVILKPF